MLIGREWCRLRWICDIFRGCRYALWGDQRVSASTTTGDTPEVPGAPVVPGTPVVSKLGEHWASWLVALSAIAVPVFVLLAWYSMAKANLVWSGVNVATRRGDFLVPVLILCVESVRRWWSLDDHTQSRRLRLRGDGHTVSMRLVRCSALTGSFIAGVLCFIATIYAASQPVTAESGDSIIVITGTCFVAGFAFGTLVLRFSDPRTVKLW
jgi:hypothetical protein